MKFHELINAYIKKYLPLLIVLYIFGLALQAFLGILSSTSTTVIPNTMTVIVYSIVSILQGLLYAGIILLLIELLRELRGTDRGQGNDMADLRN